VARIEGSEVQKKMCEVFGLKPEDITPQQVFFLVKIGKHCRLRCRSNAALHNWLKRGFPSLKITTHKAESKFKPGEMYDALNVVNPAHSGARIVKAEVAVDYSKTTEEEDTE
jgi:hypothetical protein